MTEQRDGKKIVTEWFHPFEEEQSKSRDSPIEHLTILRSIILIMYFQAPPLPHCGGTLRCVMPQQPCLGVATIGASPIHHCCTQITCWRCCSLPPCLRSLAAAAAAALCCSCCCLGATGCLSLRHTHSLHAWRESNERVKARHNTAPC